MPAPRPILRCQTCGHDLADLISTPWIRACPECGTRFDPNFYYEGNPQETPEPNALPPQPPDEPSNDAPNDTPSDTQGTNNEPPA